MANPFGFTTPISGFVDPRRNQLMGMAAGLAGGGLGGMWQGGMQGSGLDIQAQERQAEQEQLNQTSEWLKANYPQYAGLPPAEGFKAAMAEMGNAQSAAFADPASIREWDRFSAMTPEQQTQYLTMKRANPYLDVGTGFVQPDPLNSGQPAGPEIAKDNFTPAQDKALGQVIGEAAAAKIINLPQTLATTNNMVGTIEGILNDPALDASTGWLSWMQAVPGTDQYRFGQRALQLQGQAFLQAFESLKGGGQITQIEGEKATQAIGRLSTAQRPEDYRAALEELKGIINAAKQRAISGAQAVPLPPNAAIGGQAPAEGGPRTTSTGVPWSF